MSTKFYTKLALFVIGVASVMMCPLASADQTSGVPGYRYWLDSDSSDFFLIRTMQERQNQPSFRNEEILTPVGGVVWSFAYDVVLVDSFAIVQTDIGLEVYNIQDITNVVLRKRVVFDGGTGYEEMVRAGRFLYLPRAERIVILDISNPLEPIEVRTLVLSGITMNLKIDDGRLIAGIGRSDLDNAPHPAFHIYSLADSANPIIVGKYESPLSFKDARSIAVAGQYFYTANYWSNRLEIVNVADPSRPARVGGVATPYPAIIERLGDYLYVYGDDRHIRIFSIENPDLPALVDSFSVAKIGSFLRRDSLLFMGASNTSDPNDAAFVYAYSIRSDGLLDSLSAVSGLRGLVRGISARDSILFAPDFFHSMSAINIKNAGSMQLVSQLPYKAISLFGMAVEDHYAYIGSQRGRFCVVDFADTVHPAELGIYLTDQGNPDEIVADNGLLFWQNCPTSRIYSLADPANPVFLTLFPQVPPSFSTLGAVRRSNRLYQASANGLIISDITNPANPIELARDVPSYGLWARDLFLLGDLVYYPGVVTTNFSLDSYHFLTIDISNELQPTIVDEVSFDFPEGEQSFGFPESHMERRNNYIYGAFGGFGLWVIDISNPVRPEVVDRFYKREWINLEVACKRNYLFHTAMLQMEIYDISVPNVPELIQIMPLGSPCERMEFIGDYLYAVQHTGVVIYKVNLPPVDCGDADASGMVNISDVVFLVGYIFAGGIAPDPLAAGDADCSGMTNISDVVYLINYIFSGGPAPCTACS